jgi:hypothetical protein
LALGATALAQDASSSMTRLQQDLHLTPAQAPAWQAYEMALQGGAQMQARRQSAQRLLPQLQTPRRLALLEASMTQDLAEFRRQSQATVAFYDQLTPAQQRTFDHDTTPSDQGSE